MKIWRAFALVAAILLLLITLRAPLAGFFSNAGAYLEAGPGAALWRTGVNARNFFKADTSNLASRLADSEAERNRLIVENARLKDLGEENARLAALLNFSKRAETVVRPAEVIAGSADPDIHAIDIGIGGAEGLVIGDAVITEDGIVVGKISAVRAHTATAELLTDARSRFAAALLPTAEESVGGVVEGGHGTGMVMRLIPQSAKIKLGDAAITSGLEAGIPRGLVIGRIESVSQEPNEPFQSATLSPLASLDALTVVGVVLAPR